MPASRLVAGPAASDPLRIVRAEGSLLEDARGREYVDLLSGWCVGNFGWANPAIAAAVRRYDGPDYVYPRFAFDLWDAYAERLVEALPGDLAHAWRTTGGTESVDIALQLARAATGRRTVVGLAEAYHGNSVGVQQIRRAIRPPFDEAALARVRTQLKRGDVAAFVMEPVPISLGVQVPEPAFMEGVQELCRRHGTLFVLDEVATGFGRTGAIFGAEHYDVEPDIVCLAKAITGGHAPMGAVAASEDVAKAAKREDLVPYSTYGWHPRSVAAAVAVLDLLDRSGASLLADAEAHRRRILERLRRLEALRAREVRSKGLAVAVDLEDPDEGNGIVERTRERGAVLTVDDGTLQMFPALTIDRATLDRGLDALEEALG